MLETMLNAPKTTFILCSLLIFSSCASLFNRPTTRVKIATSTPSKVVIVGDTISTVKAGTKIRVQRSEAPLEVEVIDEEVSRFVEVKSQKSVAYWANGLGLFVYGIPTVVGVMIDNKSPKKYTYPKNVLINAEALSLDYGTFNTYNLAPHTNLLKISPFSYFNAVNPRVEFAFEHKSSNQWSTQFGASYILPINIYGFNSLLNQHNSGYNVSVEQRFYWAKTAPHGFYASVEGRILNRENLIEGEFSKDWYSQPEYIDTFFMKKDKYTANLKMGYQAIFKHLTADLFIGSGYSFIENTHLNRKNLNDYVAHYDHLIGTDQSEVNHGSHQIQKVYLGFQLGWAF